MYDTKKCLQILNQHDLAVNNCQIARPTIDTTSHSPGFAQCKFKAFVRIGAPETRLQREKSEK